MPAQATPRDTAAELYAVIGDRVGTWPDLLH